MGFFNKRTTKSVGQDIGKSLNRQRTLEKNIRTLEKEKETRNKEMELKLKMKMLKDERPTFGNKFRKASLQITKAGIAKAVAASKPNQLLRKNN